jgi:hypothetical protein
MKAHKESNGGTEQALVLRQIPKNKDEVETTGIWAIVHHNSRLMSMVEKLIEHQTATFADMATERQNMLLIMNQFAETHLNNIKEREGLLDKKQERKLKLEKERSHMQFMASIAEDAKVLLPHIANKLSGRKPLNSDEKNELRKFVSELSSQELEAIEAAISPAKRAVLNNLIKSALTDDEKEDVEKEPVRTPAPKEDNDNDEETEEEEGITEAEE